jgi:PadR family transcriptional regulator PadR
MVRLYMVLRLPITDYPLLMKGTHLGEFEELVLLTIAALVNDAYSVAICDELAKHAGRPVKLGVVHAVLHRLERKGYVKSRLGEATSVRGGKRKRYYTVTNGGKAALVRAKEVRDSLWNVIPEFSLKHP